MILQDYFQANSSELTDAPTWIIDPIDGTMNFVHSNPLVCTSIGKLSWRSTPKSNLYS